MIVVKFKQDYFELFKDRRLSLKSLREYLYFETANRVDFINITSRVQEIVEKSGIKEGLCLVNAMHITASVFINDDESGLHRDFKIWLENLHLMNQFPICS